MESGYPIEWISEAAVGTGAGQRGGLPKGGLEIKSSGIWKNRKRRD